MKRRYSFIHQIFILPFVTSMHRAGHWAVKMSKVGSCLGRREMVGEGVRQMRACGREHSFFSQVDGSEARQDKKLPESIASPMVPSAVLGSPCKMVYCPN